MRVASLHEQLRWGMVELLGVHRPNYADVVNLAS